MNPGIQNAVNVQVLFSPRHNSFRLIDMKNRTLCQSALECSQLAWSYVWGKEPFFRNCEPDDGPVFLSDLIKQINRGLRLPRYLPETIEDAITITESLGQQ